MHKDEFRKLFLESDIKVDELPDIAVEDYYARIPFSDVDNLLCSGRHIIVALWILRFKDAAVKRNSPWFYVDPGLVEQFGTNRKDWYRCIKKLVEMDIIKIRLREGPYGRNLYCFPENCENG